MAQISIILPVYNVEKFLVQCLDSIINQTFTDFECICVNDGSTDNSLKILEEYSNKDKRFKTISQENKGLSGARNTALRYVNSEYIVFVDSDDWLREDYLEILFNTIQKTKADIVECRHTTYYQKDNLYKPCLLNKKVDLQKDEITDIFKKVYGQTVWERIYKTNIILDNNIFFYEGRNAEDTAFNVLVFYYSKKIVYIDDSLYYHRKQIKSITSNQFKLHEDHFHNIFSLIKDLNNRKILSEQFIKYYINLFCWDFTSIFNNSKKIELIYFSKEIMLYLRNITKLKENKFNSMLFLWILNKFKLKSYHIIRILKNFYKNK